MLEESIKHFGTQSPITIGISQERDKEIVQEQRKWNSKSVMQNEN